MTPAGPRSEPKAARRGRLFSWRATGLLAAFLSVASASTALTSPARAAEPPSWIATGLAGDTRLAVSACGDGRLLAVRDLEAPLAAAPAVAPDGDAVFASLQGALLLRLRLPDLQPTARVTLAFEPRTIAVAGGKDAILLAGGRGRAPLSAHDPASLAELQRYPLRDDRVASVSALLDNPGRQGFVIGFSDMDEAWEVIYDRAAPPVLLGLVHDYRNNEAVPLPGRLTARPFKLVSPTRAFGIGPVPWEIARIDRDGALGVLNLEVRREIERPAVAPPGGPQRIAAWRAPGTPSPREAGTSRERIVRGWALAADGGQALVPLKAADWRPGRPLALDGEVLALASIAAGTQVLVAHRNHGTLLLSTVEPDGGRVERIDVVAGAPPGPVRFERGSDGRCVALLDANGRWLASHGSPGR